MVVFCFLVLLEESDTVLLLVAAFIYIYIYVALFSLVQTLCALVTCDSKRVTGFL